MASMMDMFRSGTLRFNRKTSHNNRKMTPGRVDAGKSTFKGCEPEHELVKLEKDIREKSRMMFAIDIKIHTQDRENVDTLKKKRDHIEQHLIDLIEIYQNEANDHRYKKFMGRLDRDDQNWRETWGVPTS